MILPYRKYCDLPESHLSQYRAIFDFMPGHVTSASEEKLLYPTSGFSTGYIGRSSDLPRR